MKNYIFNNYSDIDYKSLKIIKLNIKAQEGECVLLDLLCVHQDVEERLIELRFGGVLCFRGSMLGIPDYREPGLMRVRYVAKGDIACEQRESLLKNVMLSNWELPYVDPVTHQVAYRFFDYQGQTLKDLTVLNMVFKKIRRPIQSLKVIVKAKWVHKAEGILDLVPYIKRAFPFGRIQTFTGVRFEGLKGLSKIKTRTLENGLKLSLDQDICLPVYETMGEYWVSWKQSRPIEEKAVIHLRWQGKGYEVVRAEDPLAEVVEFEVLHVDAERDSYFDQEKEAVRQAIEQAVFKGYQSHQSEVLMVDMLFDPYLRLGDFVKVQDHIGRVSRLSGNEMIMTVWIMLVKNHGFVTELNGIKFERIGEVDEKQDLVKSVHIENHALEQREKLLGAQSTVELQRVLSSNKTRISVEFVDLNVPEKRIYAVRIED